MCGDDASNLEQKFNQWSKRLTNALVRVASSEGDKMLLIGDKRVRKDVITVKGVVRERKQKMPAALNSELKIGRGNASAQAKNVAKHIDKSKESSTGGSKNQNGVNNQDGFEDEEEEEDRINSAFITMDMAVDGTGADAIKTAGNNQSSQRASKLLESTVQVSSIKAEREIEGEAVTEREDNSHSDDDNDR